MFQYLMLECSIYNVWDGVISPQKMLIAAKDCLWYSFEETQAHLARIELAHPKVLEKRFFVKQGK